MVYFLYPYFWAHASKGEAREMRKYLDHPDLMHRSFLRSGAARVVVTIRPGFEDDFLSFMDNGKPGLAHQYLSIGEELQQFAKTNFPGLPSQNDPTTVRPLLTRQQRKAWDDIQEILRLAETFKGKNGHYPTSDEGLAALKSLGAGPGLDPWGRPYVFRSPGVYGEIDVSSLGADGSEGGDGENADIVSWAEASLIGQWFEYTPTRAMDIAFDERMPES
jgi:type II secretion system protein G